MCKEDIAARGRLSWRIPPPYWALVRMTGLNLVGFGALLVLLGATGHDVLSRLYTGGALSLNDAVPGAVILAIGLILLRVSGGAPLLDQVRAMRQWSGGRWISVGVVATGLLAGLAVTATDPLLQLPRWMHYGLLSVATLIILTGIQLRPNGQDRPAQS